MAGIRVRAIDHVVLIVADMERAVAFYTGVLGLEALRLDQWRAGEVPFVSLRISASSIIDLFEGQVSGVNVDHVSLWVEADLAAVAADERIEVESGPMNIFGAQGQGDALYVRDPDGHRIELKTYGGG